MKPATLPASVRESVVGLWLVAVAAAFWGPYAGFDNGGLLAFYGVILLITIGVLALQLVSAVGNDPEDKPRG